MTTGEKRVTTGEKRVTTGEKRVTTGEKRVTTGVKRVTTGEKRVTTGVKRVTTGEKRVTTGEKRVKKQSTVVKWGSQCSEMEETTVVGEVPPQPNSHNAMVPSSCTILGTQPDQRDEVASPSSLRRSQRVHQMKLKHLHKVGADGKARHPY